MYYTCLQMEHKYNQPQNFRIELRQHREPDGDGPGQHFRGQVLKVAGGQREPTEPGRASQPGEGAAARRASGRAGEHEDRPDDYVGQPHRRA